MKSRAEMLDKLILEYAYPETYCGKRKCEKCKNTKAYFDEFKSKIISLFKECVPGYGMKKFFDSSDPEKWGNQYTEKLECKCDGWNSCRTETLKNIEEL